MIYFTSDLHFYHANVIKYSNRPFKDVNEMNYTLIKNINNTVLISDELYILGDFGFCSEEEAEGIIKQIQCKNLYYIFGNHDKPMKSPKVTKYFKSMDYYKEISFNKQRFILCHYPFIEWNAGHRGSIHLHGHCHGNLKYPDMLHNKKIFDIGSDVWHYYPVSAQHIINLCKTRTNIIHGSD